MPPTPARTVTRLSQDCPREERGQPGLERIGVGDRRARGWRGHGWGTGWRQGLGWKEWNRDGMDVREWEPQQLSPLGQKQFLMRAAPQRGGSQALSGPASAPDGCCLTPWLPVLSPCDGLSGGDCWAAVPGSPKGLSLPAGFWPRGRLFCRETKLEHLGVVPCSRILTSRCQG